MNCTRLAISPMKISRLHMESEARNARNGWLQSCNSLWGF